MINKIKEYIETNSNITVTTDKDLTNTELFSIGDFGIGSFYETHYIKLVAEDLITLCKSRDWNNLNICNQNDIIYTRLHDKGYYYTSREYILITFNIKGY